MSAGDDDDADDDADDDDDDANALQRNLAIISSRFTEIYIYSNIVIYNV